MHDIALEKKKKKLNQTFNRNFIKLKWNIQRNQTATMHFFLWNNNNKSSIYFVLLLFRSVKEKLDTICMIDSKILKVFVLNKKKL